DRARRTSAHVSSVTRCLRDLTPWAERFSGGSHYVGTDPDVEQFFDVERMRMFFDPDDYKKLVETCGLCKPEERLTFPIPSNGDLTAGDDPSCDPSAPYLSDSDLKSIRDELLFEAEIRRSRAAGELIVLVNL